MVRARFSSSLAGQVGRKLIFGLPVCSMIAEQGAIPFASRPASIKVEFSSERNGLWTHRLTSRSKPDIFSHLRSNLHGVTVGSP